MLPPSAGVEPATSWSPVGRRIQMSHRGRQKEVYHHENMLYKFDSRKPHFYIVKLGFTGVYIIFHISARNIDCGYSLEPPCQGGSNEYLQSMFWAEI